MIVTSNAERGLGAARQHRRAILLATAASLSLLIGGAAHAQAQTAETGAPSAAKADTDIVVTGTRIVQDGYSAPTPVNVLGTAEILAQRPNNIADLVNTLPAVSGDTFTAANSSGSISSGLAGLNTINLRGLGTSRTLVLIDGRRTPPSTFTGLVDINTIPQDLVQRVEVVTGGASAQYGSDAVGGVVNFILDTKFKGLKLGADTGITTYGDGHNYRFSGTAGFSLLDDRLHVLMNADYYHQDGIDKVDRRWNDHGYNLIFNPDYVDGNGQPEYLASANTSLARTLGGLINSGPLRGTYFAGDGVTGQFDYGNFTSASNPWLVGGDWRLGMEGVAGTNGLQPTEERIGVFNRVAFDVTPDITIFGQFSWNRYKGRGYYSAFYQDVTLAADNAYLLTQYPQVVAAMQDNDLDSITASNWSPGLPIGGTDNTRQAYRYLAGAEGKFSLFDRPWSWNAYYQRGIVKTHEQATNSPNSGRVDLATDAVLSNGQIVCRSTLTDPTNGCVPLDRIGTGPISAESLDYIFGPEQPWRRQTITQDVAAESLSGQLFDLPGGPMAVALGGEWRKDKVTGHIGSSVPLGWYYGNYRPNFGEITVKEAFLEVALPLFDGFSLDAAGRYTDYSTSGTVQTWKIGGTYSPIPDIKFRAGYSHDIRAPNMQELFRTAQGIYLPVVLPGNSPAPGPHAPFVTTSGNPTLSPENANTLTAGAVVTPSFLPGFSASFDYFDIKLKDAIGSVGYQQIIDYCYNGYSQFCDNLVFSGTDLTQILGRPVNYAGQHVRGFDIEVSYTTPLSAISESLPGTFRIHGAATHYIKNTVDNRVAVIDYAGSPASPSWQYRVSAFYDIDPVRINLVARGFSDGVYANEYIQCVSSCPASTFQHRTINNNRIKGSMYFDGSVNVKIPSGDHEMNLTFIVNNMFNRDPELVGIDIFGDALGYPQTARPQYDTLGRVFKVALTTKF